MGPFLKVAALSCVGAGVYKASPSNQFTSVVAALSILAAVFWRHVQPYLIFAWMCFFRPIGKKGEDQRARLDSFYQGQADVYDATRTRLLRGRNTLVRLCAAHLRQMKAENTGKPLVWVDIGGGTGFNIEEMDKYFPISEFDKVYLIDLCEPLLSIARKRFAARGWKNVHVLCQDATFFTLPEWESGEVCARGAVRQVTSSGSSYQSKHTPNPILLLISLFTLSYSLSMIPSYFALLDRIDDLYVHAPRRAPTVSRPQNTSYSHLG
ncbi:hypothetical protein NM688_g3775 [Phlebia brevispora]|uniref:Uncharacterized protein n=1 Tax=Phlebia brevispora TaxID=194682 RepID=A0ACC1T508_9APHY|nr:hypothetical protein NM688_g3775 [Phlebia brevispora]